MSAEEMRKINRSLENGVLPSLLNYTIQPTDGIDWDKVRYNAFYKSPDFLLGKFPDGFQHLPASDEIIDIMLSKLKTPLEEMEERQQESTLEIISVEDIDEQN
jgi:hypothetical protein